MLVGRHDVFCFFVFAFISILVAGIKSGGMQAAEMPLQVLRLADSHSLGAYSIKHVGLALAWSGKIKQNCTVQAQSN